jgi:hypothetical protein
MKLGLLTAAGSDNARWQYEGSDLQRRLLTLAAGQVRTVIAVDLARRRSAVRSSGVG